MKEKRTELSLAAYLDKKKNAYRAEVERLCVALGNMPYETFRYKVRNKSFDQLEQAKLSEETGITKEKLFPELNEKVA